MAPNHDLPQRPALRLVSHREIPLPVDPTVRRQRPRLVRITPRSPDPDRVTPLYRRRDWALYPLLLLVAITGWFLLRLLLDELARLRTMSRARHFRRDLYHKPGYARFPDDPH